MTCGNCRTKTATNVARRLGASSAMGISVPKTGKLVFAFFYSASDYLRIYDCGDGQYCLDRPMGKQMVKRDVALALARNEMLYFDPTHQVYR